MILRFGAVGVLNGIVSAGTIFALLRWAHWLDAAANFAGYAIGLLIGFVGNRRFTFGSDVAYSSGFLRYLLAFAVAYGVNLAIVLALAKAGAPRLVAHAGGMPAYTALFYLLCRGIVFRAPRPAMLAPEPSPP